MLRNFPVRPSSSRFSLSRIPRQFEACLRKAFEARVPSRGRTAASPPVAQSLLKTEIESLPPQQKLVRSGNFSVYYARAEQMPWCLQEIGRLREIAFREVGEGTGRPTDVDLFDAYYVHVFVWDHAAGMVVGAYRLGLADEILARYGKRGLYTHSLFKYADPALRALNPAIELGRSFVRSEYQRSFSPLMLLWRGIGEFIVRHPRYATLFGAVSISNDYESASRRLIVDYLSANNLERTLARHVKPRRAFLDETAQVHERLAVLNDIEDVSRMVKTIERDGKGVPILLKQYLKLGGQLLAFSADRKFANALDGLIMVDLRASDPRVLVRYLGAQGAAGFLAHHGIQDYHPRETSARPLKRAS
jgi:putative hemolysin